MKIFLLGREVETVFSHFAVGLQWPDPHRVPQWAVHMCRGLPSTYLKQESRVLGYAANVTRHAAFLSC